MRAGESPRAVGAAEAAATNQARRCNTSVLACSALGGACTVVGGRHSGAAGLGLCGGSRRECPLASPGNKSQIVEQDLVELAMCMGSGPRAGPAPRQLARPGLAGLSGSALHADIYRLRIALKRARWPGESSCRLGFLQVRPS